MFGQAVLRARAVAAQFFSLQFGPALKVYFSGFLVEVVEVVEAGVEVVEAEVEAEVAWAMLADKVVVGSCVGYNGIVGCYYNVDGVVGCYYNIDDDDDENVGLGALVPLKGCGAAGGGACGACIA